MQNFRPEPQEMSKIYRFKDVYTFICLSVYDPLTWNFIAFKMIISIRKRMVDTDVVNGVTCTH